MVRVGSARSDENRKLVNGVEGDQRQTSIPDMSGEVSMEPWYMHSKGRYIIRAKDPEARKKIAYAMEAACNNKHIGYSQSNRWTAQDWCKWNNNENYDPATITKDVNVDCSALVRLCCAYAGIMLGDFYTSNMPVVLPASGKFELIANHDITDSPKKVLKGDILVTRSSGHTVVVLDDGPEATDLNNSKYVFEGVAYDDEFDPVYYANKYPDLKAAFGDDVEMLLYHWVKYGKDEKRIAKAPSYVYNGKDYSDEFDPVFYANKYPDLKAAFGDDVTALLQHWVTYGKNEGRIAKEGTQPQKKFPYTVEVTAYALNVRKAPDINSPVVGIIYRGQKYTIVNEKNDNWGLLKSGLGYISLKYVKKV